MSIAFERPSSDINLHNYTSCDHHPDSFCDHHPDNYDFHRAAENITDAVSAGSDAPQKSMIRKILNIAAKIALVTAAVFFVKKACVAAVSATISSPFSLALTVPGAFLWYVVLRENSPNLIDKINCKINNLI